MRIAVTGATGFVGGAVCRAAEARGWEVHAFGRRPGVRHWDIAGGPLADPPEVDAVVHAAAAVADETASATMWRTNVDGTRHVADTFPGARLVHISTASVYDPFTATVDADEAAAPVARYLNAYGESKAAAERLLTYRPNTVVLRPHAVYGPGDTTLLPRLLDAIRGRSLVIVGDGRTRHSLTSIDNLTSAVLLACNGRPGIYNIADAEPVALADALREMFRERGLRVRLRHLPVRLAWNLAAIAENTWRPPRLAQLSRYAVSHLGFERTLDITAARRDLGYRPEPTSFTGAARW
ncbi:NAD(P)-dependent oxidoreductase [Saccharopolyspora shandongensis]|uniref:NAD-dependent epimerase/dehydratase family protein n=1 Tax=Saccharopolyspora shandongensis TaxID=418495 RepID=UPI0034479848